jgi:hypothetical protein
MPSRDPADPANDPAADATTDAAPPAQTAKAIAPRFNHVAMSVPADALDAAGRQLLVDFYGEVFGWQELPTETEDRTKLVLMAHRYDQFVFLIAEDEPMRAPRLDHFGQSVATYDELVALRDRCVAYRERDDRVDLIDLHVDELPGLRLHAFYVGYLLPMMVETQYWEWTG